jgi:amino acid adenylation domain-containing protein
VRNTEETDEFDLHCSTPRPAPHSVAADIALEHAPYPLTDIQEAYWIGEQPAYRLHTPAYLYRAFSAPELDLGQLTAALDALVRAHPALRTSVLPDGTQRVCDRGEAIAVEVHDLRGLSATERVRLVAERKRNLDQLLAPLGVAAPVVCFVDQLPQGYHIHFLFRLIALDGQSIVLFINELAGHYLGRGAERLPGLSHRFFVEQQLAARQQPGYRASLAYWEQRLEHLPNAPELPLVDHEAIPHRLRFVRRQLRLDAQQFERLQAHGRRLGVTVNALLCTVYADVLRIWSRNRSFTLNMLVSQRPATAPELRDELGNFSSTLLLELAEPAGPFRARALALQRQLYRDLAHGQVAGVQVIRRMQRSGNGLPAMPVVFASTLGLGQDRAAPATTHRDLGWTVQDGALHTPQVWLDHQVYLDEGNLVLNWDSAQGVFLPGVIDHMFAVYEAHVRSVLNCTDAALETAPLQPVLPQRLLAARQAANETAAALPRGTLHSFFEAAAQAAPERPAILSAARTLGYGELWALTTRLAARLRAAGVGRNDLVAILARRGWRQVAAALGVAQSGGAYLPVASDLPPARQHYLAGQPGVKVLLAERDLLAGLELPPGVMAMALEDVLPDGPVGEAATLAPLSPLATEDDLAYVIFTSGSTGNPKGVAITHRAAVNTVQDVMERFGMRPDDRVIGISAFNFDLSVYDIFGTLAGGAALVLPEHSATPDPERWAALVREHGVTVWNTVPALLEMQLEYCGAEAARQLASLRLVMLSGDWIPVSLPDRLAAQVPAAMLVSLGGATEAAIWSNYFVVGEVDPAWKSIPYGWPLSNQEFHVLDAALQPVPTWCAGELFIAGTGLAQGYYNDPERTAASFVFCPRTGQRLYRTGDMGRYHASGHLEFLGRSDTQVKIRGYRIELGEIEAALERCPGVRGGAVVVRTVAQERQLVAFFTTGDTQCDAAAVRARLQAVLPPYMVPALIEPVGQIPVTANGKVDRKQLQALALALGQSEVVKTAPRNAVEMHLAAIWRELLQGAEIGVEDEFFQVGGTSLLAVRLLNAITAAFGKQLPLASLLRHGTVAAQARLLAESGDQARARAPLAPIRGGSMGHGGLLVLVHPVGGNVLCYRELAELAPPGMEVVGLQSPGDGATRSVPVLGAAYVAALRQLLKQRGGASQGLHLMGWSMGGVLAHEIAHWLEAGGMDVASVTMIDSWSGKPDAGPADRLEDFALLKNFVGDFLHGAALPAAFDALAERPAPQRIGLALDLLRDAGSVAGHFTPGQFAALLDEYAANFNALIRHRPGAVRAPVHQYRAARCKAFPFLAPFDTAARAAGVAVSGASVLLDEDHFSIMGEPVLRRIANERLGQ